MTVHNRREDHFDKIPPLDKFRPAPHFYVSERSSSVEFSVRDREVVGSTPTAPTDRSAG